MRHGPGLHEACRCVINSRWTGAGTRATQRGRSSAMPSAPINPDATTPTVTVRGDAIIRTEPDEAMLWITLSALEDAPGSALSDVSRRSNALVSLLDQLGVVRSDLSTTGITVYEEFDHTQSGRRSLGHRAISRVSVRLTDPDLIGRLIAQATEDLAARIDGPRWQIAPDNPVRLRSRPTGGRRRAAQGASLCRGRRRQARAIDCADRARSSRGHQSCRRVQADGGRADADRARRARGHGLDPRDVRARSQLTGTARLAAAWLLSGSPRAGTWRRQAAQTRRGSPATRRPLPRRCCRPGLRSRASASRRPRS